MAQPSSDQLSEIFRALRKELAPYAKGTVKAKIDTDEKYDLWSVKKTVATGRPRNELGFASIAIQSSYVGFYYMPIYTNCEAVRGRLGEELLKTLKGKACFHIRSADKEMMDQVREAMKVGLEVYRKNGWA